MMTRKPGTEVKQLAAAGIVLIYLKYSRTSSSVKRAFSHDAQLSTSSSVISPSPTPLLAAVTKNSIQQNNNNNKKRRRLFLREIRPDSTANKETSLATTCLNDLPLSNGCAAL